MKKILFSIALLSLGTAQAQISINEIYLQSGSFFGQNKGSLADFQTLAPGSSILQQDLSAYQTYPQMYFNLPGQSQSLSVGLGLGKMPNATLRLGLMHTSQNNALATGGSYTETFRVDTLTSSQSGEQYFVWAPLCESISPISAKSSACLYAVGSMIGSKSKSPSFLKTEYTSEVG